MAESGPAEGYALRRIRGSADPLLEEALRLRERHIGRDYRDDGRGVAHWLDRFEARAPDRLYCLALVSGGRVAGFAQFVHIAAPRLAFFDYLVLDRGHRRADVLIGFLDGIHGIVRADGLEVAAVAAEVASGDGGSAPSREALSFLSLLSMGGFGLVDAPYRQPPLHADSPEDGAPARLLLRLEGEAGEIAAEALDTIVRAIYFDHYVAWHSPLVADPEASRARVQRIYEGFRRGLGDRRSVALRGVESLVPRS